MSIKLVELLNQICKLVNQKVAYCQLLVKVSIKCCVTAKGLPSTGFCVSLHLLFTHLPKLSQYPLIFFAVLFSRLCNRSPVGSVRVSNIGDCD